MLQEKIIESKKDYLPHIPEKEQQLRKRLETVLNHFLQAAWLEDQRKYHAAKKGEQLEKHEKISRCGEIFFWLTFIAACFHFLPHLLHLAHIQVGFLSHDTYNRIFTFFAIAFPVIASACSAMRAQ